MDREKEQVTCPCFKHVSAGMLVSLTAVPPVWSRDLRICLQRRCCLPHLEALGSVGSQQLDLVRSKNPVRGATEAAPYTLPWLVLENMATAHVVDFLLAFLIIFKTSQCRFLG